MKINLIYIFAAILGLSIVIDVIVFYDFFQTHNPFILIAWVPIGILLAYPFYKWESMFKQAVKENKEIEFSCFIWINTILKVKVGPELTSYQVIDFDNLDDL